MDPIENSQTECAITECAICSKKCDSNDSNDSNGSNDPNGSNESNVTTKFDGITILLCGHAVHNICYLNNCFGRRVCPKCKK